MSFMILLMYPMLPNLSGVFAVALQLVFSQLTLTFNYNNVNEFLILKCKKKKKKKTTVKLLILTPTRPHLHKSSHKLSFGAVQDSKNTAK